MDASNMLKPALARGVLRCCGATTINEYRKVCLLTPCRKALQRSQLTRARAVRAVFPPCSTLKRTQPWLVGSSPSL